MRIAVVSEGGVQAHAPSRALLRQLARAGNDTEVREHGAGKRWRDRLDGGPDLTYPATRGDVGHAVAVTGRDGLLAGPVQWDVPPAHDIAWHAPADPRWSTSPSGSGVGHHLHAAADVGPGSTPAEGRHRGRSLVIVARWSATTPARYLAAACERAGIEVTRTDRLDWDRVGEDADGVVVVESPLPALSVSGRRRDVPVLLWAHHGEHHTDTQLRLLAHVGADAVLLAHSWHLAHRFPRPVHRFPFGLPASLVTGGDPFAQRSFDAAFVGSGIHGVGAYARRGELLDDLRRTLGEQRVAFESGQPPDRVAQLYGDARLVPNDCGSRHRPITMRVLEAVGAGAVLLTDDAPGLDRLLDPASHHVVIADPVGRQAADLLAGDQLAGLAAAALEQGRGHHTTDHRVDELLAILAATTPTAPLSAGPFVTDPLLTPIADDLLLDDVLPLGVADAEAQLPDRVVWEADRLDRLDDRPLAHAIVVGPGWDGHAERVVRAARRLVVAHRSHGEVVRAALASHPAALVRSEVGDVVAVDLGTPGYRLQPEATPEAGR